MRTPEEVVHVLYLAGGGWNQSQIARRVGISRTTVRDWMRGRVPDFEGRRAGRTGRRGPIHPTCPVCISQPHTLLREPYVYLLGLYLGDGCLSAAAKGVYKLRISCTNSYPGLMQACEDAMSAVLPRKVGRTQAVGCTELYSYSRHWICLFPQHGPGRKHERKIELADWQQALVDIDPRPLIRGLIHSDGCRVLNRASGTHYPPYPRYHFTNV